MKRVTTRKRHLPEEVLAKLRQADEALAKGVPIAEVARIRELAIENPRRGRRYVIDLLQQEGWSIGTRRMKRLWRTAGLLVPRERMKRRRIGTWEDGIVRRLAKMKNEAWSCSVENTRNLCGDGADRGVWSARATRMSRAWPRGRNCWRWLAWRCGSGVGACERTATPGTRRSSRSRSGWPA